MSLDLQPVQRADLGRIWSVAVLALAIWREARGESREGRIAIANVVQNRVAHPGWWGRTVDEVVTKRWQFSSLTDPKDAQLTLYPRHDDPVFLDCLQIANVALDGSLPNLVPGADSYHDISIAPPAWTEGARFVDQIGRLKFYDVDHDFERDLIQEAD